MRTKHPEPLIDILANLQEEDRGAKTQSSKSQAGRLFCKRSKSLWAPVAGCCGEGGMWPTEALQPQPQPANATLFTCDKTLQKTLFKRRDKPFDKGKGYYLKKDFENYYSKSWSESHNSLAKEIYSEM